MKKTYVTPEADKIQFNYRDQVVAASGNPTIGELYGNESWSFGGSCKFYGAEASGWAVCGLFSA